MTTRTEIDAQLEFVFDALVDADAESITEEDGQRVADELGIDIPKWAKEIRRMIDLYDFPPIPPLRISPVGTLGPFGLGEDDIGGPPPAPDTNLASFCFTHHGTTKKGKACWTTRHYVHHWNPISESERLGD